MNNQSSDLSYSETYSAEIEALSHEALQKLCPEKSKDRYNKEYSVFLKWLEEKNTTIVNETILLAYFCDKVN